jgi:glyoxylase-like metal-dependent hydrolase (beta-lactamase superfamily II)
MKVERRIVGPIETNCYVVACEKTREAIVVDPGFGKSEAKAFIDEIKERGLKVKYIVNTHGHDDHTSGNTALKEATNARVLIHEADAHMLTPLSTNRQKARNNNSKYPAADQLLKEGDIIEIGDIKLTVIHTPGHTKGSISLHSQSENVVFTGDTLFAQSIGRTDFPGGSYTDIMRSLKTKLVKLPDQTVVYPGHGETTTIGKEKNSNPFLLA